MEQSFTKTHMGLEAGEVTHAPGTNLVTAGFCQGWSFFSYIRALGLCVRCVRVRFNGRYIITFDGSVCEVAEYGELILLQLGELAILFRVVVAVLNSPVVELLL